MKNCVEKWPKQGSFLWPPDNLIGWTPFASRCSVLGHSVIFSMIGSHWPLAEELVGRWFKSMCIQQSSCPTAWPTTPHNWDRLGQYQHRSKLDPVHAIVIALGLCKNFLFSLSWHSDQWLFTKQSFDQMNVGQMLRSHLFAVDLSVTGQPKITWPWTLGMPKRKQTLTVLTPVVT